MLETELLGTKDAMTTVAVKNLGVAKKFYEGTLGLTPLGSQEPSVATYKSGHSTVLVYESQYAGTNKATAATWVVGDDIQDLVQALKAKGVIFEHYDMPGMKRDGEVHATGRTKAAWFKDPDGNILALVSD